MLEIVLGRYGAVSAERSEEGVCGVLGVTSPDQEQDPWQQLKAVQCALDLLDAIQEVRCASASASSGPASSTNCHQRVIH